MNIITLDFETYYSQTYSLSKMTTESYVRGNEFEVIGVAVKVNDGETQFFTGTYENTKNFLKSFAFEDNLALAHNALFDAAILTWHFGITPRGWLDTLSMARAIHSTEVGGSLAKLTEFYSLGEKGTEVVRALGKHRIDFTPEDMALYGEYCKNDVELTWKLFNCMSGDFPNSELRLIDLTIKMFSEPVLELEPLMLQNHLDMLAATKAGLLDAVGMADRKELMSNDKFAAVLLELGVEPPRKISPTTGKETWAFSKTDEGFKALAEHEDVLVQLLVSARLGLKSTQEETRTQRLLDIAERGKLPIPLRYYAAHTGRWGGDDKINMQNLGRKSPLKYAIYAPTGYTMIDADSSQIEARTVAWLAGQDDLVEAFENGKDVYKIMASSIYGVLPEEVTDEQRFVGKTTILGCIAEGTLVLCESGWKPIEQVSLVDKLWDGEEWVCHQGLLNKGLKETLNLLGVWLTADHKVLCGTQWLEAQSVVADKKILYQALVTGAEKLPSQAISQGSGEEYVRLLYDVHVGYLNTPSMYTTSKILSPHVAMYAQKKLRISSGTGLIPKLWLMMNIEQDSSIGSLLQSLDVIIPKTQSIKITGNEELQFAKNGEGIVQRFLSMFKRLMGGTNLNTKWTEPITTRVMNPEIYGSSHDPRICEIEEVLKNCKRKLQTYDLAYAGPRNRFTILTTEGPVVVHNCGYGMGAVKFRAQLKTFGVAIEESEAARIIQVYRETYPHIPDLWRQAGRSLDAIISNKTSEVGRQGVLTVEGTKGIRLPNSLYVKYPNLRKVDKEGGGTEYVYDTKKGKAVIPNRIYGGKVVENVCQALARIIIGEQMLHIAKKYKVVMTVHDAVAVVVPDDEVVTAREFVVMNMRLRPSWALGLPLNCESGIGKDYGACSKKELT